MCTLSPGVTGRSPCGFRSLLPWPGRGSGAWGTRSLLRGPRVPWALPPCPASWHSCSRRPDLWAPSEVAEQQDGAAAASTTAEAPPPRTTHPHCATGQRSVAASQRILLGSWPLQPCAPYSNYPSEPPLPFPGLPAPSPLCIMALSCTAGQVTPTPNPLSSGGYQAPSVLATLRPPGPAPAATPVLAMLVLCRETLPLGLVS